MVSIPDPIFIRMCRGITLFLNDYVFKPEVPVDDFIPESNYLQIGEDRFPLIELEHNSALETLYRSDCDSQIGKFKSDYLANNDFSVSDLRFRELQSEVRILEFIVDKVLPFYIEPRELNIIKKYTCGEAGIDESVVVNEAIVEVPRERKAKRNDKTSSRRSGSRRFGRKRISLSRAEEELDTSVDAADSANDSDEMPDSSLSSDAGSKASESTREKARRIENEIVLVKPEPSVLSANVLGGQNVMIIDDLVYKFSSDKTPLSHNISLNVGGKNVFPYLFHQIPDFITLRGKYKAKLEDIFKKEAVKDSPIIWETTQKYEYLKKVFAHKTVRKAGISLIRRSPSLYFFCLDVPEYQNMDKYGNFYRWPANKVGVKVGLEGKNLDYSHISVIINRLSKYDVIGPDGKVVMEQDPNTGESKSKKGKEVVYKHMFLNEPGDFSPICTNEYVPPGNKTLEQKISRAANIAKDTMMCGWKINLKVTPWNYLKPEVYGGFMVSKEESRRLSAAGITVTNIRDEVY
ncbi:hypothetical protein HOK51_04895 [Candidatus Woesearchaeota archaeon]|jgi:hypothetical protein|nr:hypothetical protein [Candidatus Woesearchaeota archaeon]MBT6519163.1 hypothetical protein [Candidatus Woesearchaeota archaeon]MBT7367275.1 hypothetical protein [Candidatus Woesearchaeota archaeon]